MSDYDKPWVFTMGVIVLVMLVVAACAGCTGASSRADAPKSRWWQIEAPRPDLECWETQLTRGYRKPGQRHVECWPTATIGGE